MYFLRRLVHHFHHIPVDTEHPAINLPPGCIVSVRLDKRTGIEKRAEESVAMIIRYKVPVMGHIVITTHQHFITTARNPQGTIDVSKRIRQIFTVTGQPVRNFRSCAMLGIRIRNKTGSTFLQRIQQYIRHNPGIYALGFKTNAIQQRIIFIVKPFAPFHRTFIPHAIREHVFTKVLKRNLLAPRLLMPNLECPVYIANQIGGIHLLNIIFQLCLTELLVHFPTVQGIRNHFRRQGRFMKHLEKLFFIIHLFTRIVIMIRHIFDQETSSLILQRIFCIVI